MRLVLQCSVCGTIHTVGTAICETCRASGIQNLRLLFECSQCFRLGLSPECEVCSQFLSLDSDVVVAERNPGPVPVGLWETEPSEEILEAEIEEEPCTKRALDIDAASIDHPEDDTSDFDLSMDDLPVSELNEEELRLDDGPDPIIEGE